MRMQVLNNLVWPRALYAFLCLRGSHITLRWKHDDDGLDNMIELGLVFLGTGLQFLQFGWPLLCRNDPTMATASLTQACDMNSASAMTFTRNCPR
jgi:hypothetical protein